MLRLMSANLSKAIVRENFGKRVIYLAVRWLLDRPGLALRARASRISLCPPRSKRLVAEKNGFARIDAILS